MKGQRKMSLDQKIKIFSAEGCIVKIICMILSFLFFIFGFWFLWNNLVAGIFQIRSITFIEAIGLKMFIWFLKNLNFDLINFETKNDRLKKSFLS